ncbi:cutinase family protein [Antrihabitans cavernicola]|uniref:Cutinase n=1 Tax=Antrihabitans cavernicola TaxID=2495913 RepID=A0A5A7S8K5_9NOCA|nr:cutinase family protein [Spelaeibacter cavernicola]KAA0018514.1 cutinase family protein [Spelaeibacter cavernicola]
MRARFFALFASAALAALAIPLALPAQQASAAPCPDVEAVFARGTSEPPGLGVTGTAFVEALRLQAVGKSVGSYAVNYDASNDFNNRIGLAASVLNGVRDAQAHLDFMAAACPGTKIVLGGYSQGAVVAGYATMPGVPPGFPPEYAFAFPAPLPPFVADKVAAVVFYARPSDRFMRDVGAPPVTVGPSFVGKTLDNCIPLDNICDGAPVGQPGPLHALYAVNGMAVTGAGWAVSRL